MIERINKYVYVKGTHKICGKQEKRKENHSTIFV